MALSRWADDRRRTVGVMLALPKQLGELATGNSPARLQEI